MLVNDLVRIAAAGGGLKLSAADISPNDLVRIAVSAGKHEPFPSRIVITDAKHVAPNDLVRIAVAGRGCVMFEF